MCSLASGASCVRVRLLHLCSLHHDRPRGPAHSSGRPTPSAAPPASTSPRPPPPLHACAQSFAPGTNELYYINDAKVGRSRLLIV
jgi:hypothetical protein